MKQTVTIVYFEVQKMKKYVAELPIRPDNKICPIYSDNEEEAHHYADENAAKQSIARFVNHSNREFKTKTIEVKVSRKTHFGFRAEGALLD